LPTEHTCRCGARWQSTTIAHCGACHNTFRNITGFDAHRRGGACIPPEDLGFIERDGIWATPEGHTRREALARVLATNTGRRKAAAGTSGHPTQIRKPAA